MTVKRNSATMLESPGYAESMVGTSKQCVTQPVAMTTPDTDPVIRAQHAPQPLPVPRSTQSTPSSTSSQRAQQQRQQQQHSARAMGCAGVPPPPPPPEAHYIVKTDEDAHEVTKVIAAAKLKPNDRMIIELCCGEASKLGSGPPYSAGCYVLRITIGLDFTTRRGMRAVLRALNGNFGSQILIWVSFPCTGGSSWQTLNWYKGTHATRERILEHQRLFYRLWINLERIESEIRRVGAKMAIEWPRHCAYWHWDCVQEFLARNDLHSVNMDGCAYGLVARYGSLKGQPIKKPWRIATNMPELRQRLSRRCACTSAHAPCEGRDTSETEAYTDEMAEQIHRAFRDHCHSHAHRQRALVAAMSVEEIQSNAKRIAEGIYEDPYQSCAESTSVDWPKPAEVSKAGGETQSRLRRLGAGDLRQQQPHAGGVVSGGRRARRKWLPWPVSAGFAGWQNQLPSGFPT